MRALVVVAGVCLALSVAGCNKTDSGSSAPTTLSEAQLWDPCTLPDSAIQAAGFDPSSKDTNPFGGPRAGWKGCDWHKDDYYLDVHSTSHTMDDVRSNTSLKNLHTVEVSGRQAVSYTEDGSCGVDFPTSKGVAEVIVRQVGTENPSADDQCPAALKATDSLNSSIPK